MHDSYAVWKTSIKNKKLMDSSTEGNHLLYCWSKEVKINGDTIESAKLRPRGVNTKVVKNTSSDEDGFFEFTGLGADTYVIFAKKTRYMKAKATVKLEEDESKEIEIEMKRTSKRVIDKRQTTDKN